MWAATALTLAAAPVLVVSADAIGPAVGMGPSGIEWEARRVQPAEVEGLELGHVSTFAIEIVGDVEDGTGEVEALFVDSGEAEFLDEGEQPRLSGDDEDLMALLTQITATPTTATPTTAAPTTSRAPTTAAPTTAAPTIAAPTTSTAPTTAAPTTTAPATTVPPSTVPPTTAVPSTTGPPPTTAVAGQTIFGQPYDASWPAIEMWDQMAICESGGNWAIDTGNSYYGGLQFSLGSWQWAGGTGSPAAATREEQIYRANLLWKSQGWNSWPGCTDHFGWTKWQNRL
jgi:hypothetical protein